MNSQQRTVAEVLNATAAYLAGKSNDQPRLMAELLVSRLLNCKPLELYAKSDVVLSDRHLEAMRRGMKRVAAGEPIQYVLGQWEFMGHVFKVDRRALIPRPETEVLVEHVLGCESLWSRTKPVIADIGTGSGCIVISLALARQDVLWLGLDASDEALQLARENAAAFGLQDKIAFTGNELSELVDPESLDAIVANLPYIPTPEYEKLPAGIRDYEPRIALDGGTDGLSVIKLVAQDAAIALKLGGFLFLEIGCDQGTSVSQLLTETGFEGIEISPDLAGKDRVVKAVSGQP